jgi:hypothetical protein
MVGSEDETTCCRVDVESGRRPREGLTMEVKHALEPFTGFRIGLGKALDVGRLSPTAEVCSRDRFPTPVLLDADCGSRIFVDTFTANWLAIKLTTPATSGRR